MFGATITADQTVVTVSAAVRPVLHSAIAADQSMIAISAAVGFITVRTVVTSVGPVRMRSIWSRSMRARTPRVIIVVVAAVPACIADVSVVVVDDGSTTAS